MLSKDQGSEVTRYVLIWRGSILISSLAFRRTRQLSKKVCPYLVGGTLFHQEWIQVWKKSSSFNTGVSPKVRVKCQYYDEGNMICIIKGSSNPQYTWFYMLVFQNESWVYLLNSFRIALIFGIMVSFMFIEIVFFRIEPCTFHYGIFQTKSIFQT